MGELQQLQDAIAIMDSDYRTLSGKTQVLEVERLELRESNKNLLQSLSDALRIQGGFWEKNWKAIGIIASILTIITTAFFFSDRLGALPDNTEKQEQPIQEPSASSLDSVTIHPKRFEEADSSAKEFVQ